MSDMTLPLQNVSLIELLQQRKGTKMRNGQRARCTLEFKQEAVRLVESGQSIAAAARDLGVVEAD